MPPPVSDASAASKSTTPPTTVVLVHGLGRTTGCWGKMDRTLTAEGYAVRRVGYPSRSKPVDVLARDYLRPVLNELEGAGRSYHLVAHSMGCILLRACLKEAPASLPNLHRVVMLGPPNGGSEIPQNWSILRPIMGPAFISLVPGPDGVPVSLGPWPTEPGAPELGIIAGNTSPWRPFNLAIPKPHDGKVSVASARLDGMSAFKEIPVGHTTLVSDKTAREEVLSFLKDGSFHVN